MKKQLTEHKICIIPGFSEGRHHTTTFVRVLKEHGYTITKRPEQADILIGHSGGCYLTPQNIRAKVVILANPPCDFQWSWFKHTHDKVRRDFHAHKAAQRAPYFFYKNALEHLVCASTYAG